VKTFNEVYKDSGLGKWFHKQSAGGEPGWDRYDSTGKKAGKCGDAKDGEPYAACLSKQKAQKLGKKGVASFVKRKRRAQKSAGKPDKGDGGKGAKPINVKTGVTDKDPKKKGIQEMKSFQKLSMELQEKNEPTNPKLWSSVLSQARSKFDVYPSAYANAWASKEYKKKGGGWKKKTSESVNEITVKSMDHDKALKVYEKLKKGSKVSAEFGNAMSVNNKPIELVVSSPHRVVGKSKVGRIFLKNADGKGVKYTLFNRDGKISLAQGDMGTILKDLKIVKEESIYEEMDPTEHVTKKDGCYCVVNVNGKTVKKFDNKKDADAYAIKFHDKLMKKIEEVAVAALAGRAALGVAKHVIKKKAANAAVKAMKKRKQQDEDVEQVEEKSAAWKRKEGKNKEGGLNAKGRASYERENPGSDLKAPVSAAQAKKSKGGKAAKRRKSFCARMGGMPGPMKDSKGRPTRKALALRKWDC
jgi:hypothetical protein